MMMSQIKKITLLLLIVVVCSCEKDADSSSASTTPNILFVIADDLGKDAIAGYNEGAIKPSTPHIDSLRTNGLAFNNLWVYPTCTPTRSSIITGKYGYRTDVKWASDILDSSEKTLQQYINETTDDAYSTAVVGKWHLSGGNAMFNPETMGIDYYSGLIRGAVGDYSQWQLTEDGMVSVNTDYTTQKFTDLAIDWIGQQEKPWFIWLAYNAPHTPFHVPPSNMHNQGNLPNYVDTMDPMPYYMAAIEAMDFQIGRMLENITNEELENTIIIFIGDNGTPNQVAQSPYSNVTVKGSLYQGGINVPMFISGKGVNRTGYEDALINSSDLFATIASIAGVSVTEINDSKNFKSLLTSSEQIRDYQYSEMDDGTRDAWTISNGAYKLIVNINDDEEFYDLLNDPYEQNDLLTGILTSTEQAVKMELETELSIIRN